jgi:hypothetical protein
MNLWTKLSAAALTLLVLSLAVAVAYFAFLNWFVTAHP